MLGKTVLLMLALVVSTAFCVQADLTEKTESISEVNDDALPPGGPLDLEAWLWDAAKRGGPATVVCVLALIVLAREQRIGAKHRADFLTVYKDFVKSETTRASKVFDKLDRLNDTQRETLTVLKERLPHRLD